MPTSGIRWDCPFTLEVDDFPAFIAPLTEATALVRPTQP